MSRSKAWHPAKIGDICTQVRGVSYDKNAISTTPLPNYYSLLRANNVGQSGCPILEDVIYVPEEYVSEKQVLKDNDILIVASSGSLDSVGRAASISGLHNFTFGAFCKVIRPISDTIHPRYLHHFFQRPEYRNAISSLAEGANINNLKNEHLDNLDIALPPLPEQKRIAAILDSAEAIRQKRKAAIAKLDDLAKSVFLDMFGDPVLNEKGWPRVTMRDEIAFMTSGSRGWAKYHADDGALFIKIQNVKNSRLHFDSVQYVRPPNTQEANRTKVKEGDLLISITADLGRTAVVDKSTAEQGAYINQHLALIRLKKDRLIPLFASFFLESPAGEMQFSSLDQSAVKSGLNFDSIGKVSLISPPLGLQTEFIERTCRIEMLKNHHSSVLEREDSLFSSLQHLAFAGEL